MSKIIKTSLCIFMCFSVVLGLSACSKTEMTQENVEQTVQTVETALKEFDQKTLEKYVDSKTLSYIFKLSDGHEQFAKLGQAIFENLTMEIQEIDLDNSTVTVSVKNKRLYIVASNFAYDLLQEYSATQLLNKLSDDNFLDSSLGELTGSINDAQMSDEEITVKLSITTGKRNLVLAFDDTAEDAVSGGALSAIKSII